MLPECSHSASTSSNPRVSYLPASSDSTQAAGSLGLLFTSGFPAAYQLGLLGDDPVSDFGCVYRCRIATTSVVTLSHSYHYIHIVLRLRRDLLHYAAPSSLHPQAQAHLP